jgi:hypothetical protein
MLVKVFSISTKKFEMKLTRYFLSDLVLAMVVVSVKGGCGPGASSSSAASSVRGFVVFSSVNTSATTPALVCGCGLFLSLLRWEVGVKAGVGCQWW